MSSYNLTVINTVIRRVTLYFIKQQQCDLRQLSSLEGRRKMMLKKLNVTENKAQI